MSKSKPGIEEKIAELEKQVAWFDSEDFVLEEAIERYEAAQQTSVQITEQLTNLKNTITRIDESAQ